MDKFQKCSVCPFLPCAITINRDFFRRWSEYRASALEALRVIECLKKSGLEIKDIKQFMDWCVKGASTYSQRKALFEKQRETLEAEIAHMNQVLDMLKFKCWYYGQASQDGSEDRVRSMIPNGLPEDVRKAYENAHHD